MKKVFFKIVVPNYNNERYVKHCLDSIFNQTFKDFCVILVDDLSTDLSFKIAKSYERLHPDQLKCMQLKKKGFAGACRNAGIDYPIESEYTWFIDSDDWIYDNDVLSKMHDAIVKYDFPKILRCPLYQFFGNKSKKNYTDKIQLNKNDLLQAGAGPARNCIKTKLMQRFIENRAKSNDVIWFMRTIDKIAISDIVKVEFPCQTYNRISITSCQNNIDVMLSKQCIDSAQQLASDLKHEFFSSNECIEFQKQKIAERENMYKNPISANELLSNAYVISIDQQKYKSFQTIFTNAQLTPIPSLFFGFTSKQYTPQQNCLLSHIQIVKNAKKLRLPYVCIFEDDAFPAIDIIKKLNKYLYCIPADAGLVLLGWSMYNKFYGQKFTLPFNRISQNGISGTHAYIIFESEYDRYLNYFKDINGKLADGKIFMHVNNGYVLNYPLFIQYSSSESMNKHKGYILYGDHDVPPKDFPTIDYYLK